MYVCSYLCIVYLCTYRLNFGWDGMWDSVSLKIGKDNLGYWNLRRGRDWEIRNGFVKGK